MYMSGTIVNSANRKKINPYWGYCIALRCILAVGPIINDKYNLKVKRLLSYTILLMGVGFLYKSITGSNNEVQIAPVFWHETRIIHAFLYIMAGISIDNPVLQSSLLSSDIAFSIVYRAI